MNCDRYREAISARADGEAAGVPDALLDAHLITCDGCRVFSESAHGWRRRLDVHEAADLPDVSREVRRRAAAADRATSLTVARWLLAVVAVLLVVVAVPDFLSDDAGSHALSHLGAFRLAFAIGLIAVVLRPARARTMLHVAVVLIGALAATSIVDVVRGHVPLVDESVHLLVLSSTFLLWLLARPRTFHEKPIDAEHAARDGRAGRLHVVRDDGPAPSGRSGAERT